MLRRKKTRIESGSQWLVTYRYVGLCWCEKMDSMKYRECVWNEEKEILHVKKIK